MGINHDHPRQSKALLLIDGVVTLTVTERLHKSRDYYTDYTILYQHCANRNAHSLQMVLANTGGVIRDSVYSAGHRMFQNGCLYQGTEKLGSFVSGGMGQDFHA